jgi:hypothetical protein
MTDNTLQSDRTITIKEHVALAKDRRINNPDDPALQVRLVTKSTRSPAYAAVFENLEAMRDANLTVSSIFTGVRSKKEAAAIIARYAEVYGLEAAVENLRICLLRRRKDVAEQLQLGESGVWSAEAGSIKKMSTECIAADPVPKDLLGLAEASFDLLWSVSQEVSDSAITAAEKSAAKVDRRKPSDRAA